MHVKIVRLSDGPTVHHSCYKVLEVVQSNVASSHPEHFCDLAQCSRSCGVEYYVLLAQDCSDGIGLCALFEHIEVQEILTVLVAVKVVDQVRKIQGVEDGAAGNVTPYEVFPVT